MFRYPRHKNQLVFLIRHQINIKLQYKWNILAVFFLRAGSVKIDVDIADFYVKMKVRRTFEPLAPRSTCWHTMEFINWFFWPYQFHSFDAGYPEKPYKGSRLVLFSLRPVYTLRFVGPICRPDSVGAQIVRVFWHPIYGRFVKTKIGPIQKICCSATDFCVVGPTLSKKPTCRSKFWAESMRINQKQSKWRTRRLRRGQSRAVSKRKKSPFW